MRKLVVALALGLGCGTADPVEDQCTNAPTYSADLLPGVVTRACLSCHSETKVGRVARQSAPDGMDFDRFELVTEPGGLADSITSGRMPPPSLDPPNPTTMEEREQVSLWRKCGFRR
ncbi:MAG: hypothetical protein HYV07_13520 [Deltaproteobacteria bacterium]|nr:hypothetical protein [Deltaproteobacteria bacterium]